MNPPIPWQPFDLRFRQLVDPTIMCLWWIPLNGGHEVFVGRAAYWADADLLMVQRRNGSAVCVRPGAHYAIITAPEPLPALDDAINVSDTIKLLQ